MSPRSLTASIRLTASTGPLVAPARFRIWAAGPNPGDYGELFFTPRAAAAIMGEYETRGNVLAMDIEHALNPTVNPGIDPARPPPTAGYLALELVETQAGPELWGVPRWSDCGREAPVPGEVCCAKHQIESGQRCYISPDWQIDTDTREPLRLNRVSLVAEPATWGINLLASRRASTGGSMDNMEAMRAGYAAMKAMAESADPKIAKACAAAVAAMDEHAGALGMKLGAEGADGEEKPATSEKPEGQAAAAEPVPEKKEEKVEEKPSTAAAPMAASRGAAKLVGLTREDVRAEIAREREEDRLRTLVASRMPAGSAELVASMGLDQLRTAARTLKAPEAPKGTEGDAGGNVTAGKGSSDSPLEPEERVMVARWKAALEVTDASPSMVAARAAWQRDPIGGEVTIDPFPSLLRGKRAAQAAGKVA